MTMTESFIPDSVDGWTYDIVLSLLKQDYSEGKQFDFKEVIDSKDPEHPQSILKTVAAFANTEGGFLVSGINRGALICTIVFKALRQQGRT